ncbi:MAG: RNA polymerase sigma factor [Oscillospiraceae bacterium]|nr:RNA polymerase sigma factor [Oscillospiraceae bacterium]
MIDLIKASQGDKEAFDEIVHLYNEKVVQIASIYIGNNFADVVQDVWVKILDKCHLLSHVENFDNWLFLVVRNTCFDYLKIEKKKRNNFDLPLYENIDYIDSQISYPNLLDKIIRDESFDFIRSTIEGLSEIYSLPLIMHYSKEMTLAEISQALNLPLSTVKWRIHAAKIQIKKEFKKGGYYD